MIQVGFSEIQFWNHQREKLFLLGWASRWDVGPWHHLASRGKSLPENKTNRKRMERMRLLVPF